MLIDRFRADLDKIFHQVPDSPEVRDLREEILGNLMSRAIELKEQGMDDEQIYRTCIAGMGDYTDTLKALKTAPIWHFRDRRVQGGVLLGLLVMLLGVFLYLALGFTLQAWGIAAILIFPALALLAYLVPSVCLLVRNFRLKRHATTEVIFCSYAVIGVTVLFFILAFATPVGAWRAWCVFPALPALMLGCVMVSLRVVRGKKIPFALWLVLILLISVAAYLIAAAATWLFHPLWILIPAGVAVDLLLATVHLFRKK